MGSIVKVSTKAGVKYRALVCISGNRTSKTFANKTEAKRWINIQESITDQPYAKVARPLIDYLDLYIEHVERTSDGSNKIIPHLSNIQGSPLEKIPLYQVTTKDIDAWIEYRRTTPSSMTGEPVTDSTISRSLSVLSGFFNWAVKNKLIKKNPCIGATKLVLPDHRSRVATQEEIERILFVAGYQEGEVPYTKTQRVAAAFLLATLTGMRCGEMLRIERQWIGENTLYLPKEATKTGRGRTIALSKRAKAILDSVCELEYYPSIWGLTDGVRDALWRKIRDKAGLRKVRDSEGRVIKEGLNFHDARATFCTNAAKHLDALSLARQTGHRDLKMLMRYYRPDMGAFSTVLDEL